MLNVFLKKLQSGSPLSATEIEINEKEFRSFSIEEKEQVWETLHAFFKNASPNQDRAYWWSYFRWYTELSWRFLLNRDKDFVSSIAVPRQLVMAILLDIDVWKEFIWYMNSVPFNEGEMRSFYTTTRDNVFNSLSIVGNLKSETITLSHLVKDLRLANQENNTLKIAGVQANIEELLFSNNADSQMYVSKYATLDQDDAVSALTEMIHFLIGVDPSKIESVVQVIIHNEKINSWEDFQTNGELSPLPVSNTIVQSPSANNFFEKSTVSTIKKISTSKLSRPSNTDIKKMVEAVFLPSAKQDYKGIVAMLNTLAEKYGDDHIRELYIFNEQTGTFEWNQNLLR